MQDKIQEDQHKVVSQPQVTQQQQVRLGVYQSKQGKLGAIQARTPWGSKQNPVEFEKFRKTGINRSELIQNPYNVEEAKTGLQQKDTLNPIDSDEIIPGDFYNEKGYYLGTDGKNDNKIYIVEKKADRKIIKKNENKGKTTQVKDVKSARLVSTAAGLDEALNVLKRTQAKTSTDDEGGKHEESSLVMNDGTVVRGKPGSKVVYANAGDFASTSIPKLPDGSSNTDVATLIHSHPTESEVVGDQVLSFSAQEPTNKDAKNAFEKYKVNIIAGRLGRASAKRDQRGEIVKTDASLGLSVYNGHGRVDLTKKRVKRIVKDQINRGKHKKK